MPVSVQNPKLVKELLELKRSRWLCLLAMCHTIRMLLMIGCLSDCVLYHPS